MNTHRHTLAATGVSLLALLFFAGCSQQHYSPNILYTPVMEKKGEAALSAALMTGDRYFSGHFHGSYSPINHGLLMVNHYRTNAAFEQSSFIFPPPVLYTQSYRIQFTEAGIGAYKPIAFSIGSITAGWGAGSSHNNYGTDRWADLRFNRFFVQPSLAFKNDWFRIGMGLRIVRLSYTSGDIDYRIEPDDIRYIHSLERQSPIWFPEVGGNIGLTVKPVTFTANVVLNQINSSDYTFGRVNAAFGLNFDLNFLSDKPEKAKSDEKADKKTKKGSKKKRK